MATKPTKYDKFYWEKWLNDTELQKASACARGVWINAIGRMWESKNGAELNGTQEELARICNATMAELNCFLAEAKRHGFCDIERSANGLITLRSRYRAKQEKKKEQQRLRFAKHYNDVLSNASPNAKSTPCPHADIIAAYTKWFPEGPEVRIWNQYDQGRLQQRWDEDPNRKTLKWWEKYFAYASQSEFLTGRKTSFRATLSWLVGVQNMAKVLNGQYHGSKNTKDNRHIGILRWLKNKESHDDQS